MYTFTFTEKFAKQDNFNILKAGGIYRITCKSNGSFYIGQASCFLRRFYKHKKSLAENNHANQKMQNCFNKYNAESFTVELIEIVEEVSKERLTEREQYFVDTLNPDLNLLKVVDSLLGYKHTEETVKKNKNAQRNRKNLDHKNTSGYNGVSFYKKTGQWNVKIPVAGRTTSQGLFDSIEEAYKARLAAEAKYWSEDFENLPHEEKIKILDRDKHLRAKNRKNLNPHTYVSKHRNRFEVIIDQKYIGSSFNLDEAIAIRDKYLELNPC
jgi:group I intron endonuclease